MGGWRRVGVSIVLVAATVLLPIGWAHLATTPQGLMWSQLVDETTSDRPDAWRLMRGGFAYAALPALAVLLAVMLVLSWRRSRRDAIVLGSVALLGNVNTQLVKHAPFGLGTTWDALNPLSGHVAVAAGICLGCLIVAPPRLRAASAVASVGVIGGVGAGMILAGWHSPFQVLCPLMLSTCWAMHGAVWMGARSPSRAAFSYLVSGVFLLGIGALIVVGAAVTSTVEVGRPTVGVALAILGALAGTSAAVGGVVLTVDCRRYNPTFTDAQDDRPLEVGSGGPPNPFTLRQ